MKIKVTDKASEIIKKTIKDKKPNESKIRIYISGYG